MADTTATTTLPSNTATGATTQQGLAPWIQPYVTGPQGYLTQAQNYVQNQLNPANGVKPYEYTGQLVADPSALQTQAFQGIGGLTVPTNINQAATTAGTITDRLMGMAPYQGAEFNHGYDPSRYSSTYDPSRYNSTYDPSRFNSNFQASQFTSGYNAGLAGGNYGVNEFGQVEEYKPTDLGTKEWGTQAAQQYMNPYLEQALNPQLDQARRQAEITRAADAARLTQAGAFGGSRQAIMEAEGNRNLHRQLGDITGKGYFDAYSTGMQGFMSDQQRALEAAKANEQSRQFGAGFDLDVAKANEASRQFLTTSELQRYQMQEQARQQQASLGLEAQKGTEQSRQFQANNLLDAYKASEQAMQAAEGFRGDAYKASEQAMQAAEGFRGDAYKMSEQAMQAKAQMNLEQQKAQEQSKQFGANYGLQGSQAALQAAQAQSALGIAGLNAQQSIYNTQMQAGDTQRAITQSQNQAAYDEWLRRLEYPMEMAKFQQSMMSGLPVSAITTQQPSMSGIAQLVAGLAGAGLLTQGTNLNDLAKNLGIPQLADYIKNIFGGTGDGGAAEQAPEALDSMYPAQESTEVRAAKGGVMGMEPRAEPNWRTKYGPVALREDDPQTKDASHSQDSIAALLKLLGPQVGGAGLSSLIPNQSPTNLAPQRYTPPAVQSVGADVPLVDPTEPWAPEYINSMGPGYVPPGTSMTHTTGKLENGVYTPMDRYEYSTGHVIDRTAGR